MFFMDITLFNYSTCQVVFNFTKVSLDFYGYHIYYSC